LLPNKRGRWQFCSRYARDRREAEVPRNGRWRVKKQIRAGTRGPRWVPVNPWAS